MDDSPFPSPGLDNNPNSKNRKRFVFLFFAIILILLLAFLGTRFLGQTDNANTDTTPSPTEFVIPTDTPTPEVTEEPSPSENETPTPTKRATTGSSTSSIDKASGLDRKDLSVVVQNGSGEKGVAGRTSDELKAFGYDVTGTGNADNFTYTDVTIKVKSASKDFLAILKKDLSSTYTIGSATSDLPASSTSDAVVIVGK
jgi:hypothetical protein